MSFWLGRRVVVTGARGFLGKHLCAYLLDKGAFVSHHSTEIGDLRRQQAGRELYNAFPISPEKRPVLFHLAARVSGIGAISDFPASSLYDNLQMGLNVLQGAVDMQFEGTIVLAGSVCAYPKFTLQPMVEKNLWEGYPEETNGPYGIAKRTLSLAAEMYHEQYGLDVRCPMLANLYGPGDNFNLQTSHVIPALMRKMIEAREAGEPEVTVWGTGNASRDFLYVKDAVDALCSVAEAWNTSEPINIGTGLETPISGIAAAIQMVVGYRGDLVYDTSKPDGQPRRCLQTRKAQKELGWSASTHLADGLRATYEQHEPSIVSQWRERKDAEQQDLRRMKALGFKI